MTISPDAKLTDVTKLGGVRDLPLAVRAQFARALIAEARGEHVEAAECFAKACEKEAEARGV